jgi:hypothetical protein
MMPAFSIVVLVRLGGAMAQRLNTEKLAASDYDPIKNLVLDTFCAGFFLINRFLKTSQRSTMSRNSLTRDDNIFSWYMVCPKH